AQHDRWNSHRKGLNVIRRFNHLFYCLCHALPLNVVCSQRKISGYSGGSQIRSSIEGSLRILLVTAVLALLAAYSILSFPSRKDTLDFSQFYAAGEMVRHGLGHDLYELNTQLQIQSRLARVHTFYSHPPFEAIAFVPFTFVSYRTAYAFWTL